MARTGARATSSLVILFGAGLTASLIYALATELGSRVGGLPFTAGICSLSSRLADISTDKTIMRILRSRTLPPSYMRMHANI